MAITDYSGFLDATPQELYDDWLSFITSTDPNLKDTGLATFNSLLAEAVAAEFWIFIQLLKQKVADVSILTATGSALSSIVKAYGIERHGGEHAMGTIKFQRGSPAPTDLTIPVNTLCGMVTEAGVLIKFVVTEETTLPKDDISVVAPARAVLAGKDGNVADNTVILLLTPVFGITSLTNDAAFSGGTDQEADDALRERAMYTIWINGKATIPLMTEHVAGVEGVREVKVDTVGQGDVLIIVDSEGGVEDPESAIDDMIAENIAAGCTSPGLLGARLNAPLPDRIYGEEPNETPKGIITTFTVDDPFFTDSEEIFLNGVKQARGTDYTTTPETGTIEVLWTPIPDASKGDIILINYTPAAEANQFEINDCSGGQVWVRTMQFIGEETEVPFSYLTPDGATGSGVATFPAATLAGQAILAVLEGPLAGKITDSSYAGAGQFDLFLGLGQYPYCHVCPTLQAADIDATFVLTATPEVGLLDNIKASLTAALDAYKIGDVLEWEDVYLYARVDYATGRLFQGIDRIPTFEITCKEQTITTTGERIVMAYDDRVEPGDIEPILAT